MRSVYSGLLSAIVLMSGAAASAQQIIIQVDARLICSLVPAEQQSICLQELSPNQSLEQGLNFCENNVMYSEKMECFSKVRSGVYSRQALNACANISVYDRLKCLDTVRNGYYRNESLNFCGNNIMSSEKLSCLSSVKNKSIGQTALNYCANISVYDRLKCLDQVSDIYLQAEATQFCTNSVMSSQKLSCIDTIANKSYLAAELSACANISVYDRLSCLQTMGQRLMVTPRYNPNAQFPTPIAITPYNAPKPAVVQVPMCDLYNSSSSLGKTVAKSKFFQFAANMAEDSKSCLMAHINGEAESRTLFSSAGTIVESDMSESQATGLKQQLTRNDSSYARCKVLICR